MSDWRKYAKVIPPDGSGEPEASAGNWRAYATVIPPTEKPKEYADISIGASALAGAAQGATLSWADELMGGLKTAGDVARGHTPLERDAIEKQYEKRRDSYRKYLDEAKRQNEKSFLAGEIAASAAPAFIPGAAPASLARIVGTSALQGAAYGAGESKAKDLQGIAADTGTGALWGAAGPLAIKGAGKVAGFAADKAGDLAKNIGPKQLAKAYLGLPEQAYERLVQNPDKIKAALAKREDFYGLPNIGKRLTERVDELAEEAVSGSAAGRETLRFEGAKIPQSLLRERILNKLEAIKADEGQIPNEAYAKAKDVLKSQLEKLPKGEVTPMIRDPKTGRIVKLAKRAPDPDLTGTELMDRVREMRRAVDYNPQFGAVDPKSSGVIKSVAHDYDQLLKQTSPAYQGIMKDAAEAASLLERAKPLARNEQGALNFVNSIDKAGNKFRADTLKELDKRFGDTLTQDALDAIAARTLDRSVPAGSQRTNIFGKAGRAIGGKFGDTGEAIGMALGGYIDAYGRRMAIPLVEKAAALERSMAKRPQNPALQSLAKPLQQLLPMGSTLAYSPAAIAELRRRLGEPAP